jgi:NAD(P)-dependent dehydrogenase (short-subunit alcohol dehydrogenase family)
MTRFDFARKIVLVTGGASGIGLACAKTFALSGAQVVIADTQAEAGAQAAASIVQTQGSAGFIEVDVANPASAQAMVDSIIERHGALDIAINNAGIGGGRVPTAAYSIEAWQQVINVNLSGVFYCLRAELPVMIKQGGGVIVNLASILGSRAMAGTPAYTASKHGVIGLTRTAAIDHAKDRIRVNAIGPGFIETPMIARAMDDSELNARIVALHPIGHLGQPQDIANLAAFLCSDEASFITGGYYLADGGYTAQ